MADRYRKSIKLASGVRLSHPGTGIAWRSGQKNATLGIGRRCPVLAVGKAAPAAKVLPALQDLAGAAGVRQVVGIQLAAEVNDHGLMLLKEAGGALLSDALSTRVKTLRGEEIRLLMQKKCDAINRQFEALGEIHIYTPPPDTGPQFEAERYVSIKPKAPAMRPRGFLGWLFASVARQIDERNRQLTERYDDALNFWESEKSAHENRQAQARSIFEGARKGDIGAMERMLEARLSAIVWPCEILVTLSISADGTQILMDVSLPDLADMPIYFALLPARGLQLGMVEIPQSQVRYQYMRLVHAIGFRVLGEVFANLNSVTQVLLSAYVQRKDEITGDIKDQFTYSVAVHRYEWRRISFNQIRGIDIVSIFSGFTLRRGMAKTGVFSPITPFVSFPETGERTSTAAELHSEVDEEY